MLTTESEKVRGRTHIFQNIRPPIPEGNAICAHCRLVLPHGPLLIFELPPCRPVQDNG